MEVTNSFKGLDMLDRVPKEQWMEVHNIAHEAEIKTIPKEKKNMQHSKIIAWGSLTNS